MAGMGPPEECEPGEIIKCGIGRDGTYVGLSQEQTRNLRKSYPPGRGPENPERWYEYVAVIACSGNDPHFPDRVHCEYATTYCEERQPGSSGPYSYIYRRIVDDDGNEGAYESVAPTCYRSDVPPRSGEPVKELTEEMIIEQFHQTDFALPSMSIEPPDGRTLVNLPVFYEAVWPEEGYEPDEIDTTDIIGFEVRIRPVLESATYHFGDGNSIGPTDSLGGPYPDGDVTHEYAEAATVEPYITVIFGGEVSVDGSAWTTIPGSVSVDGPLNPLEILTSSNQLFD
ncbi:hypothetical protein [Ornithinimicrobium murale]|uniref:hypothetical protein n=1 Tax=Ornithinimicrobium murale TaxID=1050153 RepID=UPI0013B44255|nr:hypothetical protein [Ornithinimicrobium murale]